ncbi:DUF4199 domain-containing protein [Membranihabitans marinus]|uniref:DUF4199 domain-containing protein n=1 Tax=Membranihabitans marinus TaxID=1227546 RepID=UPI001F338E89|nr:DUF4199 domain-containing protein [Membranihabitans marinus]
MNSKRTVLLGVMAGVAVALIMLVIDFINNQLLVTPSMSYFPTLVLIFAMFFAVREEKKQREYFPFSEVFKTALVPFIIGNAIYLFFNFLLYNYIDPALGDMAKERALEIFDSGLMNNFMSEEQMETMIETIQENTFRPTLMEAFTGYALSLIVPGALVALLLSLIYRTRS